MLRGREVAARTFGILSSNLQHAIKTTGITNALPFCSVLADPLTRQVAAEAQADVRRVTHRARNPKNQAETNELGILDGFRAQLLAGTGPASPLLRTNTADTVTFYAPIVITNALCLNCHGVPGTDIDAASMAVIQKLYPQDEGTGFKLGELRGMWRIDFAQTNLVAGRP